MDSDWNDFKVLLALARGGSIAAAARTLGLDHSTVSRRLTALEDSIGSRLLIRGGREFTLTAQGQAARESAEQIEEAVAQVSRLVRSEHLSSGGTVRVSVSPGFIVPMMPMLDIARIKYPNLDIQLLGDYRRVDLAKGEADIAVRMARPDELGLVGRRTFESGWCPYACAA